MSKWPRKLFSSEYEGIWNCSSTLLRKTFAWRRFLKALAAKLRPRLRRLPPYQNIIGISSQFESFKRKLCFVLVLCVSATAELSFRRLTFSREKQIPEFHIYCRCNFTIRSIRQLIMQSFQFQKSSSFSISGPETSLSFICFFLVAVLDSDSV